MYKKKIIQLVKKQNKWRLECINLIASENVMSPFVERFYLSDFMHRYAEGLPFKRYYQGTRYIDELEDLVSKMFKKYFRVNFVDLRPISGTLANFSVFSALSKRGDKIMTVGLLGGAHISHEKYGAAGVLGLKIKHFEFNFENYTLDLEKAKKDILKYKPKFIILGSSVILFPLPLKELKEICQKVGTKIVYDAAHVFGLIAGGEFQDPSKEGADVITASTHKTFPGPQGGIVLGNVDKKTAKKIQNKIFPSFHSNHHLHRIPALGLTLLEMEKFGKNYARQTIKNAQVLAQSLAEFGFEVLGKKRGFTQSHQVLVNVEKQGGGDKVAKILEAANIIVNKNTIALDKEQDVKNPKGIRIGVQEMTRFGMKEKEMKKIAQFIKEIVLDKKNPERMRKEVVKFRKDFQKVKYCFK
jgi:glycine hydroxymethyltransferase